MKIMVANNLGAHSIQSCIKFPTESKFNQFLLSISRKMLIIPLKAVVQWKCRQKAVIWLTLHWFTVYDIPLHLIAGKRCNDCSKFQGYIFHSSIDVKRTVKKCTSKSAFI